MITTAVRIKVLVFVIVSVLGIGYVAVRYVGVGESLLGRSYVVYVDFTHAGGIFANAPVTYRGVPIGRVTAVTLHDDGARARLRIDDGVRVPVASRAVVAQRSAVGEQYLDLRPDNDSGPYLRDGAVVPRERTGVPLPPETLLTNLDALIRSVDQDDLAVVIDELGKAFEGSEDALRRILDASNLLLTDATTYLPETVTLIQDGNTVLATQAASAEMIRRWARGLAELTATVKASDPDIRGVLAAGPPAAAELVALLDGLEPTIGTLLGNLTSLGGIAVRRLPNIEHLLVVYPMAVAGGFTIAPGDGTAHFGLVLNVDDPPSCRYAGEPRCTAADESRGASVRGANNAPRVGGTGQAPPPSDATGGSTVDGESTNVAGFDPVTGQVLGPDGRPLRFGGTGGQYALAGEQSWKQLLLP